MKQNKNQKNTAVNQITEGVIWKQLLIFFSDLVWNSVPADLQYCRYSCSRPLCGKRSIGSSRRLIQYDRESHRRFFVGLCSGASVVISQFYGAKDHKNLKSTSHIHDLLHGCQYYCGNSRFYPG